MPLMIARPFKHPETGVYQFRRVVPEDLRALVGKREEKRSLRTKDAEEAERRFSEVAREIEAKCARVVRIYLFEPDEDGGEGDDAEEVEQPLAVASGHAAELLEFGKAALDRIALRAAVSVVGVRPAPVGPRRDHGLGVSLEHRVVDVLGVVGAIGDDVTAGEPVDEFARAQHFALLAGAGE